MPLDPDAKNAVDLSVPNTTLSQLGGKCFIAMTGAKEFVGSADTLKFRVGSNAKKITVVTVRLVAATDTYTMTFYRGGGLNLKQVAEVSDVYAEDLCAVFEKHTGMYTSL